MNLFDPANYPTREPEQLVAGDRWAWKRIDLAVDYPPAEYTLKYAARREGTDATEIEIMATGSGSEYVVEVASAQTEDKAPGRYRWQAYITRTSDSQRVTVGTGIFEVIANRDTATTDPRSHARKCLESIEAALEAFAKDAVQSYTITTGNGSRTVTKRDTAELLKLRNHYRSEVAREERIEKLRAGLAAPAKLQVRL